jgi:hypothetical protein
LPTAGASVQNLNPTYTQKSRPAEIFSKAIKKAPGGIAEVFGQRLTARIGTKKQQQQKPKYFYRAHS